MTAAATANAARAVRTDSPRNWRTSWPVSSRRPCDADSGPERGTAWQVDEVDAGDGQDEDRDDEEDVDVGRASVGLELADEKMGAEMDGRQGWRK